MATNFKVWMDDIDEGSNIYSSEEFAEGSQRIDGFQSNVAASSKYVNSALRQANLVACALMESILPNNSTLSLVSPVNSVKEAIKSAPWPAISGTGMIGSGYTPPLQGYDTSKGTIETRLQALGFNSATVNIFGSGSGIQQTVYKQGKIVYVNWKVSFNLSNARLQTYFNSGSTTPIFTLPTNFVPEQDEIVPIFVKVADAQSNEASTYTFKVLGASHYSTKGQCVLNEILSESQYIVNQNVNMYISFGLKL